MNHNMRKKKKKLFMNMNIWKSEKQFFFNISGLG